jgi:aspartate/methionine/tyrosine aminotransferase
LPDFPWDLLAPAKKRAAEYPGGIVDLSMGTPVDPVPAAVQAALAGAADSPGYPLTAGSPALRAAITGWVVRHCRPINGGGADGFGVLPTIGSKELVAGLPTLLGLGPGDVVVIPSVCYPTYDVGARLAGAEVVRSDDPAAEVDPERVRLVFRIHINRKHNEVG